MTTEEFEKEIRKLQTTFNFTEQDIRKMLEMHKRIKSGKASEKIKELKSQKLKMLISMRLQTTRKL